jgi:hypothetical protein
VLGHPGLRNLGHEKIFSCATNQEESYMGWACQELNSPAIQCFHRGNFQGMKRKRNTMFSALFCGLGPIVFAPNNL